MNMFYNQRLANFSGGSSYYDKIDLDYEGNTKIDNDQINEQVYLHFWLVHLYLVLV